MIDKKGFVKILDLNVPSLEHFDYYINQLSKTERYKDIYELYSLYEEAEFNVDNLFDYRIEITNQLIEHIKSTNAYNEMCYDNTLLNLPTNKICDFEDERLYLSIDIRNANWISLKNYDPEHINELGLTYEEFLSKFNIPKIFHKSKYLRQFVFSNLNPKKQSLIQRNMIQQVVRQYSDQLNVEFVRTEEAIFSFNDFNEISDILTQIDKNRYKIKIFKSKKVEDFRIESILNSKGEVLSNEIIGVEPSKFFMKFKEYITKESLDVRDLYFRNTSGLAVWVVDNLKLELK